jgi:hypothetical protein
MTPLTVQTGQEHQERDVLQSPHAPPPAPPTTPQTDGAVYDELEMERKYAEIASRMIQMKLEEERQQRIEEAKYTQKERQQRMEEAEQHSTSQRQQCALVALMALPEAHAHQQGDLANQSGPGLDDTPEQLEAMQLTSDEEQQHQEEQLHHGEPLHRLNLESAADVRCNKNREREKFNLVYGKHYNVSGLPYQFIDAVDPERKRLAPVGVRLSAEYGDKKLHGFTHNLLTQAAVLRPTSGKSDFGVLFDAHKTNWRPVPTDERRVEGSDRAWGYYDKSTPLRNHEDC